MPEQFDAYHEWLGISPKDQPPNHYRLLGIDLFESKPNVIAHAADQRMVHIRSFQTGKHSDLSQKLLNEIAAAKICLLNAKMKLAYDQQLRESIGTFASEASENSLSGSFFDFARSYTPKKEPKAKEKATPKKFPLALVASAIGVLLLVGVVAALMSQGNGTQEPKKEVALKPKRVSKSESKPQPEPKIAPGFVTPQAQPEPNVEVKPEPQPLRDPEPVGDRQTEEWISRDATYVASSQFDNFTPLPSLLNESEQYHFDNQFAFHTAEGGWKGGYIVIDLGKPVTITRMYIQNRVAQGQERAAGLTVWLSGARDQRGTSVWKASEGLSEWNVVLKEPTQARYVTMGLPDDVALPLHLRKVKVFGYKGQFEPEIAKGDPTPRPAPSPEAQAQAGPQSKPESRSQTRQPVPDEADQKRALATMRDVYKDDYKDRTALARKVLQKAKETQDVLERFVLLREANNLAGETFQFDLAFETIDAMADKYDVNGLEMKADVLDNAAKRQRLTPEQKTSIADAALQVIDEAIGEDNYDVAKQMGRRANQFASLSKDNKLIQEVTAKSKEVVAAAKAFAEVKEAMAALKERPADPEVNLTVGKYLCFRKGDWDKGLPMLALGSDEKLASLAEKDKVGNDSPKEQVKLGDAWLDAGGKKRARFWYKKAFPQLAAGLEKDRVEKRLSELDKLFDVKSKSQDSNRHKLQKSPVITVMDYDEEFFTSRFPRGNNRAGGGMPEKIFRGDRTGTACEWNAAQDRFMATWANSPRGRYLILFGRVGGGGKGHDAWGNAVLSVNGGEPVPISGMSSTMVAVVDLGQVVPIQNAILLTAGGTEGPGLAGIEIHETMVGEKSKRTGK